MLIAVAGSSGLGEVVGVDADDPGGLLQAVRSHPAPYVLLLTPLHSASAASEQAHVVVAADHRVRVCVLPLEHHALTLTLLAAVTLEQEGERHGWRDPGAAVQLLRQGAARSRSIVWHPRLGGLEQPEPSWRQRFAATFRRPGYFAELGIDSGLVRGRTGLLLSPEESLYSLGDPPVALAAQLLGQRCRAVPVQAGRGRPYAGKASVEITALVRPPHPPAVTELCPTCAVGMTSQGCDFCGTGPRPRFTTSQGRGHRPAAARPVPATTSLSRGTTS